MKILISGGTGLIGQALANELMTKSHHVTILTRSPQKHEASMPGATLVRWDGRTPDGWAHHVESAEAVVNLAGASIGGETTFTILTRRWTEASKQKIMQSRLDAGRALTEAITAAKRKPRVLIQSSAVGYYGARGDEMVDESFPSGEGFVSVVCTAWEASTKSVREFGVRHVVVRSGLVMSRAGGILPMMLLPFRLFVGGPLGSGDQFIPWIHIEDEVRALVHLLEDESASGAYNLSAPNPVTNRQFGSVAGRVLRRPSIFPVPSFALKLLLGEKAALVLEGQRLIPKRLNEEGFTFRFTDLELALRDLMQ